MFEQALVLRAGGEGIDVGLVAETVFFYGKTHLLLNQGAVLALARAIPRDELLELFDRDAVQLSYLRKAFVVHRGSGPLGVYDLGAVELYSKGVGQKRLNFRDEIELALEEEFGKSTETTKLAKAIGDRVRLHKFKGDPDGKSISDQARRDIRDASFLKKAIVSTLRNLVPAYEQPQFHFRLLDTGQGYAVDTNLDFKEINGVYHQRVPPSHSSIDPAFLLAHIHDARADLYFAAYYMAEPVTAPVYSDIIKIKHFEFLHRRDANVDEVAQFRDVVVPQFPTIREAINAGERSFADFLKLLDQADRFKKWIQKVNPDAGLVSEYHKAATANTWVDKLPSKSVRFAVATGVGLAAEALVPTGIGAAIGMGAGATDSMLLDRLLKGWRPNHFIAGPYRKFVTGGDQ